MVHSKETPERIRGFKTLKFAELGKFYTNPRGIPYKMGLT